jgi:hypothetical protein
MTAPGWKDILVTALNPPRNERSFSALDVAGDTGDVAFRIAAAQGEPGPGSRFATSTRKCLPSGANPPSVKPVKARQGSPAPMARST